MIHVDLSCPPHPPVCPPSRRDALTLNTLARSDRLIGKVHLVDLSGQLVIAYLRLSKQPNHIWAAEFFSSRDGSHRTEFGSPYLARLHLADVFTRLYGRHVCDQSCAEYGQLTRKGRAVGLVPVVESWVGG